jgi:hypothetical protein
MRKLLALLVAITIACGAAASVTVILAAGPVDGSDGYFDGDS